MTTDQHGGRAVAPETGELDGWAVLTGRVPVAVRSADPAWSPKYHAVLHNLGGAIAWALRYLGDSWVECHSQVGNISYVIDLAEALHLDSPESYPTEEQDEGDDPVPASAPGLLFRSAQIDEGGRGTIAHVVLSVDSDQLARTCHYSDHEAHQQIKAAVEAAMRAIGVADEQIKVLRDAWSTTKPTMTIRMMREKYARPTLPKPWPLDEAVISQAKRTAAIRLRNSGVAPAVYSGGDLRDLDNNNLAPAALEALRSLVARYEQDQIVATGLSQLECLISNKNNDQRDVTRNASVMDLTWDPAKRLTEINREILNHRVCIEAVVEVALRDTPSGTHDLDKLEWIELIAAAQEYLESTYRSERIHHQVRPISLRISEVFTVEYGEVTSDLPAAVAGRRVYDLDVEAFQLEVARFSLSPVQDATDEVRHEDPTSSNNEPESQLVGQGELDTALLGEFGATSTDILSVLLALSTWPVDPTGPPVALAVRSDVVAYLNENLLSANEPNGPGRIESALDFLTLNTSLISQSDWRPWQVRTRRNRLLVRPIVQARSSQLWIAPHYFRASGRAYFNYLAQGQLPWSNPIPPGPLEDALSSIRDLRNKELEFEAAAVLRNEGYVVIDRLQPEVSPTVGIPSLSGEIDILATRAGSPILWLLEVKDPADVFSISEIRRSLDRFFVGSGSKKAYEETLMRKIEDVEPHVGAVCAAMRDLPDLNLPDADLPRVLRAAFVTRHPVAAAFVTSDLPFTTTRQVIAFLRAREEEELH